MGELAGADDHDADSHPGDPYEQVGAGIGQLRRLLVGQHEGAPVQALDLTGHPAPGLLPPGLRRLDAQHVRVLRFAP